MSILRPLYWIGSSVIGIAALQIDFCVLLGGARTDHVMAIRAEYSYKVEQPILRHIAKNRSNLIR